MRETTVNNHILLNFEHEVKYKYSFCLSLIHTIFSSQETRIRIRECFALLVWNEWETGEWNSKQILYLSSLYKVDVVDVDADVICKVNQFHFLARNYYDNNNMFTPTFFISISPVQKPQQRWWWWRWRDGGCSM